MTRLKIATLVFLLTLSACAQSTTPIQPNKPLTPEQIAAVHGKLFSAGVPGQIQERLRNTEGDVTLMPVGISQEIGIDLPLVWKLQNLACESDLVVIAKADAGTSHATMDQSFIYTDWQFTIQQVLKDNPKAPVRAGDTITVTRPGGTLEINGRKVVASLRTFRAFVPGEELLLYVHFVPATGAYSMRTSQFFGTSEDVLKLAVGGTKAAANDVRCGGARF
jgi:hypothetical protein